MFMTAIRDVSRGKVNILGGHSIGHSKQKKVYMYMCPILNGFRDRGISLYSYKIVDKKEIHTYIHKFVNSPVCCPNWTGY
jgi:hypothetical protein